jgi:hypothetical protein
MIIEWLTVIPSAPGAPLLALTRRNASFKFSRSTISSIVGFVLAGLSGAFVVLNDSDPSPPVFRASPVGEQEKSRLLWMFCRMSLLTHVLLASLLVRAFNHRFRLSLSVDSAFRLWSASLALPTSWPTMPSADFCSAVRMPRGSLSRRNDTEQISRGKFNRLLRTVAGSTLCVLDGYGLRGKLPARPTLTPCIRFLSIDSRICSTLPSDPASRR